MTQSDIDQAGPHSPPRDRAMPANGVAALPRELMLVSEAKRALQEASSVHEVKTIRDKAAAVKFYMQQSGECLEAQNAAAEIKLRAERRAGELLSVMEKNKGTILSGNNKPLAPGKQPTLKDLGIHPMQSSRFQQAASIPEQTFERHIEETKAAGKELTTASVVKLAKRQSRHPDLDYGTGDFDGHYVEDLSALDGKKFGTVYADPPWNYGNQATRASTDNHYETMSIDDLCAMPIANLVEDRAHLHLWTTNGFLEESFSVMRAWGFEFKSCLVWIKPQMGIGNYYRLAHEFLMLGTRGGGVTFPPHAKDIISWIQCDRGKHSAKPDEARKVIETASPGPYLELFGRERIPGWTVFGNQISPQRRLA